MGTENNIVTVKSFDGKYKINESYRPIAEGLKAKFGELQYVPVKNILFVENLEDKRKKDIKTVFAQMSKVPGRWEEIIYQMTGRNFEYIMEIFRENTQGMSRQQIIALVYHELKHIQLIPADQGGPKVGLVGHDVEDWTNMISKLGVNWPSTKSALPDLLDENINWENIEGPATLFPAETFLKLKVVK